MTNHLWSTLYSIINNEELLLQDVLAKMFPWYYIRSDIISMFKSLAHTSVLPTAKEVIRLPHYKCVTDN